MSYYLMTQNQLQDYCKIQDKLHVMGENGYYTIRGNPAEKMHGPSTKTAHKVEVVA